MTVADLGLFNKMLWDTCLCQGPFNFPPIELFKREVKFEYEVRPFCGCLPFCCWLRAIGGGAGLGLPACARCARVPVSRISVDRGVTFSFGLLVLRSLGGKADGSQGHRIVTPTEPDTVEDG